jgi:hypothetical protein
VGSFIVEQPETFSNPPGVRSSTTDGVPASSPHDSPVDAFIVDYPPPQPHRRQHRQGRFLRVVFVPAVFEDEEWFGAMCGCFGERDGFSEAFERERLALGDAQHFISDETANLG